jgi:hypothetical protein
MRRKDSYGHYGHRGKRESRSVLYLVKLRDSLSSCEPLLLESLSPPLDSFARSARLSVLSVPGQSQSTIFCSFQAIPYTHQAIS